MWIGIHLVLDLLDTILPEREIGYTCYELPREIEAVKAHTSDTILAVVEEHNHAIGVHGLASVLHTMVSKWTASSERVTYEFVVLEVGDDLLCEGLGTLLESLNTLGLRLLELRLDGLHVALENIGQDEAINWPRSCQAPTLR